MSARYLEEEEESDLLSEFFAQDFYRNLWLPRVKARREHLARVIAIGRHHPLEKLRELQAEYALLEKLSSAEGIRQFLARERAGSTPHNDRAPRGRNH